MQDKSQDRNSKSKTRKNSLCRRSSRLFISVLLQLSGGNQHQVRPLEEANDAPAFQFLRDQLQAQTILQKVFILFYFLTFKSNWIMDFNLILSFMPWAIRSSRAVQIKEKPLN